MKQKYWFSIFISLSLIFILPLFSVTVYGAEGTDLDIASESAILMDTNTKTILYEKNAYDKHYPASITKLMTALLAIENLKSDDQITFSWEAVNSIEPGSNHIGIKANEILTVDQALHGLLLMSANEVANGLAEAVSGSMEDFAVRMTERAKELGAQNTHFTNAHGLHNKEHYTTAYDMALIASYISQNEYFLEIMKDLTYTIPCTNITDEERPLYQQHHLLNPARGSSYYREDLNVIGGKTGYTDQARQTLVTIAKQKDTTLVAVILKSEKPTIFEDTNKLLDYGFSTYQSLKLHTSDEIIKTLPGYNVKSGQAYQYANFGLSLSEDVSVVVPNTVNVEDIVANFAIPEELNPTSQIGDKIGTVSFVLNGKTLIQSDVMITQVDTLPEPSFSSSIRPKSFLLLCIISFIVVIGLLVFIITLIKKRRLAQRQLKINKLFK